MADELDMRLLRHFVAVAEELHFSRAAARLFLAQQALSRDVGRLERQLGVRLLDRTSRRVTLTPAGADLLERARPLLAHHDEVVRSVGGVAVRFLVDPGGAGLTPAWVLARARRDEDGYEFYSRDSGGLGQAARLLARGELDVAFGTWTGDAAVPGERLARRLVRREPLALLLPAGHPWAGGPVRAGALAGTEVCWRAGNQCSPEWDEVARAVLGRCGARTTAAHPPVRGVDELAHHVREGEPPVLVPAGHPPVPGTVLAALADPVPSLAWTMVWRAGETHPGLAALHRAVDALAAEEAWEAEPAPG